MMAEGMGGDEKIGLHRFSLGVQQKGVHPLHANNFRATLRCPSSAPILRVAGDSAFRLMPLDLSPSLSGGLPASSSGFIALGRSSARGLGSRRGAVGGGASVK